MVATLQMDRIMSGPRLPVARCDAFARCQAFGSRFAGTMPRNIQAKQHLGGTIVAAHDAASMGTPEHESPDLSSSDRQSGAPSTSQSSDLSEGKSSNGFTRFWYSYNEKLEEKPILIKSLTSLVGFALGDILAQVIGGSGAYNVMRTVRLTLFGIFMDGPVGHWWYTTLDKAVLPEKPKSNKAVVLKTALDQLIWAPFFTCVFFTFMCCLEGRPNHIMYSIQKKLIPVLLANYVIWPAAHIINFKFIPSSQRILYINVCQVLWSSYLSACQAK